MVKNFKFLDDIFDWMDIFFSAYSVEYSKKKQEKKLKELDNMKLENDTLRETKVINFDKIVLQERYTLQKLQEYQQSIQDYIKNLSAIKTSSKYYRSKHFDFIIIEEKKTLKKKVQTESFP